MLENRKIGGVPVVDQGGRLVGVITQSDLVERARDLELPPAINILDFHIYLQIPSHLFHKVEKMLGTTVGDCMTENPVTVAPDTPVAKVAALMAKQKVHTIPVVEGDEARGHHRQDGPGPGHGPRTRRVRRSCRHVARPSEKSPQPPFTKGE